MNYKSITNELQEICELPNGSYLYVKTDEAGGRTYLSDEIGDGIFVWDTALVDMGTLFAALTEENRFLHQESVDKHKNRRN